MVAGARLWTLHVDDSDGDRLPDLYETATTCHGVGTPDADLDLDGDTLDGLTEYPLGTDPCLADTDSDGLDDAEEIGLYGTDPLLDDTDGDGLEDGDEVTVHGTDPNRVDSDSDALSDFDELTVYDTDPNDFDSDDDSFSDGDEIATGTDPNDPNSFKNEP